MNDAEMVRNAKPITEVKVGHSWWYGRFLAECKKAAAQDKETLDWKWTDADGCPTDSARSDNEVAARMHELRKEGFSVHRTDWRQAWVVNVKWDLTHTRTGDARKIQDLTFPLKIALQTIDVNNYAKQIYDEVLAMCISQSKAGFKHVGLNILNDLDLPQRLSEPTLHHSFKQMIQLLIDNGFNVNQDTAYKYWCVINWTLPEVVEDTPVTQAAKRMCNKIKEQCTVLSKQGISGAHFIVETLIGVELPDPVEQKLSLEVLNKLLTDMGYTVDTTTWTVPAVTRDMIVVSW